MKKLRPRERLLVPITASVSVTEEVPAKLSETEQHPPPSRESAASHQQSTGPWQHQYRRQVSFLPEVLSTTVMMLCPEPDQKPRLTCQRAPSALSSSEELYMGQEAAKPGS